MRTAPLLFLLLLAACISPPGGSTTGATTVGPDLAPLPARHLASFDALREAVRDREDAVARRILLRLQVVLAADRARVRGGGSLAGARSLAPGTVDPTIDARRRAADLATLDRADEMVSGFERVLDGRERVDSLRLSLETRPTHQPGLVRLVLCCEGTRRAPLVLRPGPGILRTRTVAMTPAGQQMHSGGRTGVATDLEVLVQDGVVTEVPLGTHSLGVARDSIATRTRFDLEFRSGRLTEDGVDYPAMRIEVEPSEVRQSASFLPNTPVEPDELLRYIGEGAPSTPALLERVVRLEPEREDEVCEQLAPLVERLPLDVVVRLDPALRWLTGHWTPVLDPRLWPDLLRGDSAQDALDDEDRRADDRGDRSDALDLPVGD